MEHLHQLQKYTCPMHPHILLDAPGKCPLCGMTLEPVANDASVVTHGKHSNHTGMIADFRKRFYVVLLLTVLIMLLSQIIPHWLNFPTRFPGSKFCFLDFTLVFFFF